MTTTNKMTLLLGLSGCLFIAGCGPTFDPASLVTSTRVVGARIEVEGASDRASPVPGETVDVTWLVTSPDDAPSLGWTFALCAPGAGTSGPTCLAAPLARFDGTADPPRIAIAVPSEAVLGGAASLTVYGGICAGDGSMPQFDAQTGLAGCANGDRGTTVTVDLPLQQGDQVNHNPVADHSFSLNGASWPASVAGDDPCAQGPRVAAGSTDHVIGNTTEGADRERYTAVSGDPPVAMPSRENLQISQFTTAGKLKSQFSFVEASDDAATTIVDVRWDAPEAADVPAAGLAVTFTFVVRDDRGGTDWTTRALCVTP
ncbi:MAG TPA: hypothetical protein VHH90_02625 [Polyangia bacterium]|nr:hypothetical protein [Polyangia bacterium]